MENHQEEEHPQQQQPDIYAVLSSEDPIEMDDSQANALVMDIISNDYSQHPLSKNISNHFPTPSPTTAVSLNEDFMNFNLFDMNYDSLFTNTADTSFSRRHSVALGTDVSDFNLRFLQYQQPQQQECSPIEHRASLPNILTDLTESSIEPSPLSADSTGQKRKSSGEIVDGRRQSCASAQDLDTWNRMISSTKRIKTEQDVLPAIDEDDYPIITQADRDAAERDSTAIPRRQKTKYKDDEYTPKWVRYTGQLKEGYCDTCQPGKWLQLKNSAYWYHKQFFHGISSVTGRSFQGPIDHRRAEHDIIEGLCHQCKQYVAMCNAKRKNSVLWFRHAHKCHIYDKPLRASKKTALSTE